MSISLNDISVAQLALYCVYFALICEVALAIWILFMFVSNVIEKLILSFISTPSQHFYKKLPSSKWSSIKPEAKNLIDKINRITIWKNRIKAFINWQEKIVVISLILFLILLLIKLLISNETFAYTIITLFIFIISNQIASYLRTAWSTDRYIISPIIKIGEYIEISDEIGTVEDIGKDFFWLDCVTEKFCKKVRFPLSYLNFQKFAKISEDYRDNNNNNGGVAKRPSNHHQKHQKKNNGINPLMQRKIINENTLYDFNMANDFEIKIN